MNADSVNGPLSIARRILVIYQDFIPSEKNEEFLIAWAPLCRNPDAQEILDALHRIDEIVDPYNPLPANRRKARKKILVGATTVLARQSREKRLREIKLSL